MGRRWIATPRRLLLALDRGSTTLALQLGCLLMALISVLGLWQVLSRFVLSQPSVWTEELMRRLLIWCVMLGVVVAFRRGAMISVDLAVSRSRGAWQRRLEALITTLTLAFLGVLLAFGLALCWRVRQQSFASLELSMAWAYAALPVGAMLSLIAVLAQHLDPHTESPESIEPSQTPCP